MNIGIKTWRAGAAIIPFFLLLAVWAGGSQASAKRPQGPLLQKEPAGSQLASKVSAELQQQFDASDAGARLNYWVILKDQADTRNNIPNSRWAEKGWYVYNTLVDKANSTQAPLLARLGPLQAATHVTTIESFWIINLISVHGDYASAISMAADPAVKEIIAPTRGEITGAARALSPQAQAVLNHALQERKVQDPKAGNPLVPLLVQHNIDEVHAPQAWAMGYDGTGIVVSSMDTGVRHTHEALTARYRGYAAPPDPANIHDYNWYDGYLISTTPLDQNDHGTHTMGTAAGNQLGGSTYGNIGVARGAIWTTVRICGLNGTNTCDGNAILRGFQWTLAPTRVGSSTLDPRPDLRPSVSNNSWAGAGCDATFNTAVQNWVNAGIYPDFSNGNAGPGVGTVGSPASAPSAWGTGNLNTSLSDWAIAASSGRGPSACDGSVRPHAVAPGTSICSSIGSGDTGYNCAFTGTSMAAPHVAGAAAILLDKNPNLTIPQITFALTSTAFFSPTWGTRPNNDYGWGLIRIDAALNSLQDPATPTGTSTSTPTPSSTPACETSNYSSTNVPLPIPDRPRNQPPIIVYSNLVVPAGPPIFDIAVTNMRFDHSYPDDLDLFLISPQGTRVELVTDRCGGNDWTNSTTGFNLARVAPQVIGATCPPGQNTYRPDGSLNTLIGQLPGGTWRLEVSDDGSADAGTLRAWGLSITSGPACSTIGPTSTNTRTATRTVTHTATNTPGGATATRTRTPAPTGTLTRTATPTGGCAFDYASTNVPRAITDDGTITSTLSVASGPTIASVEVRGLRIAHEYAADLDVFLVSPAGTVVQLFTDICGAQNWTASNTGFNLSDTAGIVVGTTCPPGAGTYGPEAPLTALAGENPVGTWKLRVTDDGTGDVGTLNAWGLRIIGSAPCP